MQVEFTHWFLNLAAHHNHSKGLLKNTSTRAPPLTYQIIIYQPQKNFPNILWEMLMQLVLRTITLVNDTRSSKGFCLIKILRSLATMWNHNQMSTSRLVFILLLIRRESRKSKRKCQA